MPEGRSIAVERLLTDPTLAKVPLDALSFPEKIASPLGTFRLFQGTEHEGRSTCTTACDR